MIILAQDNEAIYDTEKSVSICIKDNTIYMLNYSGELAYPLGKYKDADRAREVVEDIFTLQGCQEKYEMPLI